VEVRLAARLQADASRNAPKRTESRIAAEQKARANAELDDMIFANSGLVPCETCEMRARKRVAVSPVTVGDLPERLQSSPEAVGGRLRDQIEARLAAVPSLLVANRSHLEDVMFEQKLAASGATVAVGRPQSGRLVNAQVQIHVTVETANLVTRTEKQSTNDAASCLEEVAALEAQAMRLSADADASLGQAQNLTSASYGYAYTPNYWVQAQNNAAIRLRQQATNRSAEAHRLRSECNLNGQRTLAETISVRAEVRLGWTAVDTSTGMTVASGKTSGVSRGRRYGTAVESASGSSSTTVDTPDGVIVNVAVDRAVLKLGMQMEEELLNVPFRAKIAQVQPGQVVINAGTEIGLRVGDMFRVRRAGHSILDPDTGLPLEIESVPVGVVRVRGVQAKIAIGSILKDKGGLRVGDELEWVGVAVAREDLPGLQEEAAQRAIERELKEKTRARQLARQLRDDPSEERGAATALFEQYANGNAKQLLDELLEQ
jgi:hypothetical protein